MKSAARKKQSQEETRTIWTDEKHSQEETEPGRNSDVEKVRGEKIRDGESQKTEDACAPKGREVAKHRAFPMICGSGMLKSRIAKEAGAEPAGQMKDEKMHAIVARSTFAIQNVKSTSASDHFWKLRCRRCGAKHIWKSKCAKHPRFRALLEVEMSKKCTPLWCEARFEVKSCQAHRC